MPLLVLENPDSLKAWVGREIAATEWFPVTQDRIQQFAEAIEDRQWIHVDRERAQRESPYGATVAHGFLTLSLLSQLWRSAIKIGGYRMSVNYGFNRVRFPSPVPADSNIRAHITVQSIKDIPQGREVVLSVVVESQSTSKPCCVADWVIRFYL